MSPRRARLHVVVATGDGARLLRLTAPRWSLGAAGALGGLAVAGLAVLVADYTMLRASRLESAAFETRLAAERSTSGRLLAAERDTNARLRSELDGVRREIGTWPSLHAKIVSPFGRTAPALDVVPAAADVDAIGATIRRATGTLRQIAGLMMRLDTALSHLPSSWPVRAAINSEFGHRRSPWTGDSEFHRGIDIRAAEGEPVRSPASGAVAFTGTAGGYGLTVVVDHGSNVRTRYGHLSRVSVQAGQQVERGQVLGRAGNTGRSTGTHLHYEVLVAGRPVNPRAYLWD